MGIRKFISIFFLVHFVCCNESIDIWRRRLDNAHYIDKKTFSSSRIIYVAGLEGTGHHAFESMVSRCLNNTIITNITTSSSNADVKPCEIDEELSKLLMLNIPIGQVKLGLFFTEDSQHVHSLVQKIESRMAMLASKQGDHVYFIGLGYPRETGMHSYPSYGGSQKALNHPDVYVLAQLAEKSHADLRIIVLQRNAKDILKSTKGRHFGGSEEPRILIDNAAILYTQLMLIDPRFVYCVKYEEMSNLSHDKAKSLINFLHPQIIKPFWNDMIYVVQKYNRTKAVSTAKPKELNVNFTKALDRVRNSIKKMQQQNNSNDPDRRTLQIKHLESIQHRIKKEIQSIEIRKKYRKGFVVNETANTLYYEDQLTARLQLIDNYCERTQTKTKPKLMPRIKMKPLNV
jgi:hypothetical protein